MSTSRRLRDTITQAIAELRVGELGQLIDQSLHFGVEATDVHDALTKGMEKVGERFERGEYFLSDLIMAGELMKDSLKVLKPYLTTTASTPAKVVIGTIEGDLHDIGKDIVLSLLVSAGMEVHDLGIDVPAAAFAKKAKVTGARVVGVSALLSTTIPTTMKVVEALKKEGIRDKVKVIIGGAAVRNWAVNRYGVDAAVNSAVEGVNIIKGWIEGK